MMAADIFLALNSTKAKEAYSMWEVLKTLREGESIEISGFYAADKVDGESKLDGIKIQIDAGGFRKTQMLSAEAIDLAEFDAIEFELSKALRDLRESIERQMAGNPNAKT